MGTEIIGIILVYAPLLYLLAYSLKSSSSRNLAKTSNSWTLLLLLAVMFAIAYYPEELSSDKFRYVRGYYAAINNGWEEFRDYGWVIYNRLCGSLFGQNIDLFFILTAFIYTFSYYIWGRKIFTRKYVGYFVVMSIGCLGFSNYGTNVIRSGLAISILIIAANLKLKWSYKVILALIALSIHKSMIIPITAFLLANYIKNIWFAIGFWIVCLGLSVLNIDLSALFETVGFVDERISSYAGNMEEENDSYEQGFRVDFLIYSIVPLFIAFYYKIHKKISDIDYDKAIKIYLYCNAIWLLVIRMAYTDRMAYFSWFLIPFISLYPVIKYQSSFKKPQRVVLFCMFVFMFVPVLLSLRSLM